MTALAGFWAFDSAEDPAARCKQMLKSQNLYGPHHSAVTLAVPIALGRNLFRLVPEDGFDRQPVRGASGNLLVADVRLDNRGELSDSLSLAVESKSLSDTDLLMHALDRWDEGALDRIVGDFAFALWKPREQRLLLARDYLGQRPLVYHRNPRFFAFSSMAKGLHALPEVDYAPDRNRMAEFTALLPERGSATFFKNVAKVEAGHILIVTQNGLESRRYWNPSVRAVHLNTAGDYAERLRELLNQAVVARLRGAGASVGAQLSGGLDSSAVTATAARLLADSDSTVLAFTSVPRQHYRGPLRKWAVNDEGPLAATTAALYPNVEHILVAGSRTSPLASLDRNFFLYERPILNLANWTWFNAINAAAKERGVSVLLNGNMGNIGFSWGGMDLLPLLLKSGRLWPLARHVAALRRGGTRWGTIGSQAIGPFLPPFLWRAVRRLRGRGDSVTSYSLIDPAAVTELRLAERAQALGMDMNYRPPFDGVAKRMSALGLVDFGNYNKGILAEWGIDYRDPTADRRVIEFCLSVPAEEYLRDGVPRALARRAFADRLPQSVVNERLKGYQAIDWHEGFDAARQDIETEVARIGKCADAAAILNLDKMRKLVDDWPAGSWNETETIQNYRISLLRTISNGHFLRKASGSNR